MNREDLFNGVTDIRDDLIDGAENAPKRKKPDRWRWAAAIAAMLAVVLIVGLLPGRPGQTEEPPTGEAHTIAAAIYPDRAPYSETDNSSWRSEQQARLANAEIYDGKLDAFFAATIPRLLSGAGEENRVYSPVNVYMALSMLAELTDGNSRQQLLDLLGCDSIEAVRSRAGALWNANYVDDGTVKSLLASSLWLNEDIGFVQRTMDALTETYYASSFEGVMGSESLNQAMRQWISDNTGGLLTEQADGLELTPDTILALVTTIYYGARWSNEFWEENTAPDTFHAPDGDVTADFMHQTILASYCRGGQFSAVPMALANSGAMWLILPDEGVGIDGLLAGTEVMDLLIAGEQWEKVTYPRINLSVPKFDIASDMDLQEQLQALGITDVFDPAVSDFSPMAAGSLLNPYVSQISHAARVRIDEEGCEAAAYTMIAPGAAGGPDDMVDFVLDRPFLFAITGDDGSLLFAGVVNRP